MASQVRPDANTELAIVENGFAGARAQLQDAAIRPYHCASIARWRVLWRLSVSCPEILWHGSRLVKFNCFRLAYFPILTLYLDAVALGAASQWPDIEGYPWQEFDHLK